MESSHSEANVSSAKETPGQGVIDPANTNQPMRPSPSSDQLASQPNTSQILQQITRF